MTQVAEVQWTRESMVEVTLSCLLYTSDAADDP